MSLRLLSMIVGHKVYYEFRNSKIPFQHLSVVTKGIISEDEARELFKMYANRDSPRP